MEANERYIKRCIDLAKKGFAHVAPNPMVGCVIVCEGKVIGEGYHRKYGEAHAEVNAINAVNNDELLKKSTLYVSLEPCAHFGKTPPCSNLIIEKKIPTVVIGCVDPYAEVAGKGIEKLRKAGVEVVVGVLEKESLELNKRFFTFHKKKRPYIVLKWAQTLEGFMDRDRMNGEQGVNWITSPATKQLTDTWRSEEMAILVGKNTVLNDNPKLTVRTLLGRSPIRLVIDKKLEISESYHVMNGEVQTYVFNQYKTEQKGKLMYVKLPFVELLQEMMNWLYERELFSVLVEGGRATLQHFLDEGVWDEARIYIGDKFFNGGLKAPQIAVRDFQTENYGGDKLIIVKNK